MNGIIWVVEVQTDDGQWCAESMFLSRYGARSHATWWRREFGGKTRIRKYFRGEE